MINKRTILCIVPLPPPMGGAAMASETIIDYLKNQNDVTVIAYQRGNLISGKFSIKQMFKILMIGIRLKLMRKHFDVVYLVISSSFLGSLRDIFWLVMMGSKLRKKTVLHLHTAVFNKGTIFLILPPFSRRLAKRVFADVRKGIVVGEAWLKCYDNLIPRNKVFVVKNCFSPYLLIPEDYMMVKFNSKEKINILFISNLMKEKGYDILLDAFLTLPESVRSRAVLHFAGNAYSSTEKKSFLQKIENINNIIYHGFASEKEKRNLLWNAHVLCFPTFYKYETQGIVILEAYASGCIVLTTNKEGIKDIFSEKNGFFINKENIKNRLEDVITNIDNYKDIAYSNRSEVKSRYSEEIYCKNLEVLLIGDSLVKRLSYEGSSN